MVGTSEIDVLVPGRPTVDLVFSRLHAWSQVGREVYADDLRVSAEAHFNAAGAGDQAAAALGVGVARPGPVSLVLGTSGVVFAALQNFAADPEARVHSFCHALPATWHAMGVMLSAAGSLA